MGLLRVRSRRGWGVRPGDNRTGSIRVFEIINGAFVRQVIWDSDGLKLRYTNRCDRSFITGRLMKFRDHKVLSLAPTRLQHRRLLLSPQLLVLIPEV